MPRIAWASGDERALQITCGGCDEQTVISLMRLRMLAFLRCGCGNMLLDEDEVREYRRRLERDDPINFAYGQRRVTAAVVAPQGNASTACP